MKARFIKIAHYDPKSSVNNNLFDAYARVTSRQSDPVITDPISYQDMFKQGQIDKVFSSPLNRARQSAQYLGKKVEIEDSLIEVLFNLQQLVSRKEFDQKGSSIVRSRFVKAFIDDALIEKRHQLKNRVSNIANIIRLSKQDSVFVSHSFIMKIIEAELITGNLFTQPELLGKFIKPEHKTYHFGGGFEINVTI